MVRTDTFPRCYLGHQCRREGCSNCRPFERHFYYKTPPSANPDNFSSIISQRPVRLCFHMMVFLFFSSLYFFFFFFFQLDLIFISLYVDLFLYPSLYPSSFLQSYTVFSSSCFQPFFCFLSQLSVIQSACFFFLSVSLSLSLSLLPHTYFYLYFRLSTLPFSPHALSLFFYFPFFPYFFFNSPHSLSLPNFLKF